MATLSEAEKDIREKKVVMAEGLRERSMQRLKEKRSRENSENVREELGPNSVSSSLKSFTFSLHRNKRTRRTLFPSNQAISSTASLAKTLLEYHRQKTSLFREELRLRKEELELRRQELQFQQEQFREEQKDRELQREQRKMLFQWVLSQTSAGKHTHLRVFK
eukprot:GILJ01014410.1.p1 GENE.GILJ01014410.1~~GILJ01014410.1.p1  ORF type:complete len:163 (+),score=26.23 GILJ01014410.1:156-644(+)